MSPTGPVLQIGRLKVTGPAVPIVSVALLAGFIALLVWMRPRLGMLLSGGIWLAFSVYWSVAGQKVAPTKRAEAVSSSAKHQMLRQLALLLLFVPVWGLQGRLVASNLTTPVGLAIQLGGAIFYLRAKRELGRAWSSEISIKQDQQLVRSGPYRLVRHPLYSGMLLMSAGTTIVANQVHAVIALALMAAAYWLKITIEERWMREEFGTAWDEYRRSTRALIPWML